MSDEEKPLGDAEDEANDAEDEADDGAGDGADEGAVEDGARPPPTPTSAREGIAIAAVVTITAGAAITFAFNPENAASAAMLGAIGAVYVVLGAVAILRLRARGELAEQMKPRYG